jgi:hypothetical protein
VAEKYGGLQVSDTRRLRARENEIGRLTRIVADLTLNLRALKDVSEEE